MLLYSSKLIEACFMTSFETPCQHPAGGWMRNTDILLIPGKNPSEIWEEIDHCVLGCGSLEWSLHIVEMRGRKKKGGSSLGSKS